MAWGLLGEGALKYAQDFANEIPPLMIQLYCCGPARLLF